MKVLVILGHPRTDSHIVGVVLQCNNFEVIDIGVMQPGAEILKAAKEHDVDVIGLSGLITPSLEEMANFAADLEREGMTTPLMIGGATTSRAHTAVKIEPNYSGPVVWVKDASRAVGVAQSLISPELRENYAAEIREEYEKLRVQTPAARRRFSGSRWKRRVPTSRRSTGRATPRPSRRRWRPRTCRARRRCCTRMATAPFCCASMTST